MGKTMNTLTKLRQHYDTQEDDSPAATTVLREASNINTGGNETSADVIEFEPEDLNPLKPEEADECQLAAILQGNDLSFLMERSRHNSESSMGSRNNTIPPSNVIMHRIPSDADEKYVRCGSKRRRLSE